MHRLADRLPLLARQTLDTRRSIDAVYYRNTTLASRITRFVDHVVSVLGSKPFDEPFRQKHCAAHDAYGQCLRAK